MGVKPALRVGDAPATLPNALPRQEKLRIGEHYAMRAVSASDVRGLAVIRSKKWLDVSFRTPKIVGLSVHEEHADWKLSRQQPESSEEQRS